MAYSSCLFLIHWVIECQIKKTTDSQPSVVLVKFEVLYNMHQNNALCMLISYIYLVISDWYSTSYTTSCRSLSRICYVSLYQSQGIINIIKILINCYNINAWKIDWLIWFDLLCLMPFSAIFQLYHGDQF
jgi:hypothetical protein